MSNANVAYREKEIRTYLSISQPIDPAQVFTLADLDMSYALGSTLVDWDDSKQILAGLASRWAMPDSKTLQFTLSEKARWSTGAAITSIEVKQSLERAKRVHGKDLRSLFDAIDRIECPDAKTLEFHVHADKSAAAILKKLTEPMYGVLRIKGHDQIDLGVSSGPYVLSRSSASEVALVKNSHWINHDAGMAEHIILRQPVAGQDQQTALISDPWPNLVATHSLMKDSLMANLREHHLTSWKRSLDRTLMLAPFKGRIKTAEGFQFFRYLQKSLDRSGVTHGLTGHTPATQLFPNGSSLAAEDLTCAPMPSDLPVSFKGKKLRVLISPERVSPALRDNFSRAIEKAVGATPSFHEVPLTSLLSAVKQEDYDFYLGSFGVADPNIDGALSYYFELGTPPIPSGQGAQEFSRRTVEVRSEKDEGKRLALARAMLKDVVCYGHIVPLLHFSTVVIARAEIDLGRVPTTDECISFSKVRFR